MYHWFSDWVSNVSKFNNRLFNVIGFLVPLIVFIVVIAIPSETEENKNKIVNYFVVARIIFLIICIIGMIYNFVPLFIYWKKIVIPNRVDSSSDKRQKEIKENIKKQNNQLKKDWNK